MQEHERPEEIFTLQEDRRVSDNLTLNYKRTLYVIEDTGENTLESPGRTGQIWRAWTTENCVQFVEIPQEPYATVQNATRSVYADDANCVAFWNQTAKHGTAAIEAAVYRGLEYLFTQNGIAN